jgi:OOP family OmpA-OmpF porin
LFTIQQRFIGKSKDTLSFIGSRRMFVGDYFQTGVTMKPTTLAVALALCCGASTAAMADEAKGPYMGVLGSYMFPDSSRNDDDGLGARLLFGFPMNNYLSSEISLFANRAEHNYDNNDDRLLGAGFDLNMKLAKTRLAPFLLIGGGYQHDDIPNNGQDSGYANAGGGLLWNVGGNRDTSIRLEGRRLAIFNDELNPGRDHIYDTQVNLGVQVALSTTQPAPPPPPPPPVVIDSDGDGVPDTQDACPGTVPGTAVDSRGCPLPPPDSDGDGVPDDRDACPNTTRGLKVDARGCAIKAQVLVLRDVNFEFDSAALTADARNILDGVAAGLKGQPSMEVHIEGHTDSKGADAYNLRLSKARAESVRNHLIQSGVSANRLKAQGYGESKPVADNKTDDGRAMNRRVEFKVIKE